VSIDRAQQTKVLWKTLSRLAPYMLGNLGKRKSCIVNKVLKAQ
jgi:hypothetical protein